MMTQAGEKYFDDYFKTRILNINGENTRVAGKTLTDTLFSRGALPGKRSSSPFEVLKHRKCF